MGSKTAWDIFLVIAIAVVIVVFLEPLLLAFAAVLFGILLGAFADAVARHTPLSRRWSLVAVLVVSIGALAVLIVVAAPHIAYQIDLLVGQIPDLADRATRWLAHYGWGRWLLDRSQTASDWLTQGRTVGRASAILGTGLGAIGSVFVVLLGGLFIAIEPTTYARGLLRLLPAAGRDRGSAVALEVGHALRTWVLIKLVSMLFIFVTTWIGLALIGIPLSLTLAVLAALLTFIPNFGPVLSAVPSILLSLPHGWTTVIAVVGLYAGAQLIESSVLTPSLERHTVQMPPALTLMAQVAMGLVAGPLGVVLAAPLTAAGLALGRGLTGDLEERVAERAERAKPT
jgi:predicted PurR-regulated permease PerM